MRFFTKFSVMLLLLVLGQVIFSGGVNAAGYNKPSDFFGKYQFKAKMELTAAGEKYEFKDELLAEGEVTITESSRAAYMMDIIGLAGGVEILSVSSVDYDKHTMQVNNPNLNYQYWSNYLCISDAEGMYPMSHKVGEEWVSYMLDMSYDPETGNISLPDFTAVTCDWQNEKATIIAKFTECSLTLVKKDVVAMPDLSGTWKFTSTPGMESSFNYSDCDITLTPTAEDFSAYTAELQFAEGIGTTITDVTFDGEKVKLNFKDAYLDAEKQYALISESMKTEGAVIFNYASENSLSLASWFMIGKANGTSYGMEQYYGSGNAVRSSGEIELAGTYNVSATIDKKLNDYDYASDFLVEIVYKEDKEEYRLMEFAGLDVKTNSYNAGITLEREGNTLSVPTGMSSLLRSVSHSETEHVYDILGNADGEFTSPVTITLNEDGTITISDFTVVRTTLDAKFAITGTETACKYTNAIDATGISDVTVPSKGNAPEGIYTVSGVRVADKASKLNTLPTGMYIVKDGNRTVKVVR